MKPLNLVGEKIGRWSVLSQAISENGVSRWVCRCECGTERVVGRNILMSTANKVKSCGCWRRERIALANKTHGAVGTPTYYTWTSMLTRCRNPNFREFKYWGGRGIKVCERWEKYENFLEDMGERPEGKTLDRFPNKDGDYEPGNCRWATPKEQRQNQRPIYSEDELGKIHDRNLTAREVAKAIGRHPATVQRLRKLASYQDVQP
jgi:hypothetical protein